MSTRDFCGGERYRSVMIGGTVSRRSRTGHGDHVVVKIDEWAPSHKRLWCSCGTKCLEKSGWTAEQIWDIHRHSFVSAGK